MSPLSVFGEENAGSSQWFIKRNTSSNRGYERREVTIEIHVVIRDFSWVKVCFLLYEGPLWIFSAVCFVEKHLSPFSSGWLLILWSEVSEPRRYQREGRDWKDESRGRADRSRTPLARELSHVYTWQQDAMKERGEAEDKRKEERKRGRWKGKGGATARGGGEVSGRRRKGRARIQERKVVFSVNEIR